MFQFSSKNTIIKKFYIFLVAMFIMKSAMAQWVTVYSGLTADLLDVHFPSHDTGFIVGDNGKILRTVDAGSTWSNRPSGTNAGLTSVFFTNVNQGFVEGNG